MIEFDPAKAACNLTKHGLSFEDAEAVLYDKNAYTSHRFIGPHKHPQSGEALLCEVECEAKRYDKAAHSAPPNPACQGCELRHITTGLGSDEKLATIVWTQRKGNKRLISMRAARTKERKFYYGT